MESLQTFGKEATKGQVELSTVEAKKASEKDYEPINKGGDEGKICNLRLRRMGSPAKGKESISGENRGVRALGGATGRVGVLRDGSTQGLGGTEQKTNKTEKGTGGQGTLAKGRSVKRVF